MGETQVIWQIKERGRKERHGQKETQTVFLFTLTLSQEYIAFIVLSCLLD